MAERIPTNRARQGRWGVQVLVVLVVALALSAAAWLGLEFYGEAIDTHSQGAPGAVEDSAAAPNSQPAATP